MNKHVCLFLAPLIFILLVCSGCDSDEDERGWSASQLLTEGAGPMPSSAGDDLLYILESDSPGLYLYRDGISYHLNPEGPAVRSDYRWSDDGSMFCFSSPGQIGQGDAGIYIAGADSPTSFERIWDRGSHPGFLPDLSAVVCAGPEDGSADQGIWLIDLVSHERESLAIYGVQPEPSPDGHKIAYLLTTGDASGRALLVFNRQTLHRDTLAGHVVNFTWLSDSETLVYESVQNSIQELYIVTLGGELPAVKISVPGSNPAGLPNGRKVVFTGLDEDLIDGIFLTAPGTVPVKIWGQGTRAVPVNESRILVQADGIWILSR